MLVAGALVLLMVFDPSPSADVRGYGARVYELRRPGAQPVPLPYQLRLNVRTRGPVYELWADSREAVMACVYAIDWTGNTSPCVGWSLETDVPVGRETPQWREP